MQHLFRASRHCHWSPATVFIAMGSLSIVAGLLAPSYAFGPTGHRVVGRIAENYLSSEAEKAVRELIGPDTLAEVSTWADEIRSDPKWAHSGPWHYVNIESGKSYHKRDKKPTEDPRDIIEAIEHFEAVLNDRGKSNRQKAIALKWLVHLVGDLHQPLHVGRAGDRGGNSIGAVWFGAKTNLHAIWDSGLIDSTRLSFSELAEFIKPARTKRVDAWQDSRVMDWVGESRRYRRQAYRVPDPDTSGSYRYSYENLPLVKLRLAQAGVRLAGMLNSILGDPG